MRSLIKNKTGTVQDIGMAVSILVAIVIAIVVVYNMAGSMDMGDVDTEIVNNNIDVMNERSGGGSLNTTYAGNATVDILDQSATFFTIAPLVVVVLVAVVILSYVMQIGGARRP